MEDENMNISNKGKILFIGIIISISIFGYVGFISKIHTTGTWNSFCSFKELSFYPNEIIQIGNTMFLAYEGENITIFKSNDGCDWSEIISPTAHRDIWSSSIEIFKTPEGNLGIVWEETTAEKKPRSSLFWSFFTGTEWSEPQFLFYRDESCILKDALMLNNGALLLLWEEPLVRTYTKDGRTLRGSGCDLLYRAYFNEDKLFIEKVFEPEDPILCYSNGHGFIKNGQTIWCIFEYCGYDKTFLYRSWSEDGIQWSTPEPFVIQGININKDTYKIFSTSEGIGILSYRYNGKEIFLFQTKDWEHWSKEMIFSTEKKIKGVMITQGKNYLWGFIDASNNILFISSSNESGNE